MRTWVLLSLLFCVSGSAAAQAWTWTDENGQVHYSDRPVPGARQVELGSAQSAPMPGAQPSAPTADASATQQTQPYRALVITRPDHEETLWNTGGTLSVEVELDPPSLLPGHQIEISLDGERQNVHQRATRFELSEVWRGTHTLQALVLDEDGRALISSDAITVVIQQTSIQNPNNPNVPRQAPRQNLPAR